MTTSDRRPGAADAPASDRLPVVVVGAGVMGALWIRMLADSPHAALVGVVDLDVPLAESAVRAAGPTGSPRARPAPRSPHAPARGPW